MLCDPLGHGLLLADHMGESCWEGKRPAEQMCVCVMEVMACLVSVSIELRKDYF